MSWFPALQAKQVQNVLTAAVECATARCREGGCLETWRGRLCYRGVSGVQQKDGRRSPGLWPPICTEGLSTGETYAGTRYHSDTHSARITCSVQRVGVQYGGVERRGERGIGG